MRKKLIAIACVALTLTSSLTICGCDKKEGETAPTNAPVKATVPDAEGKRVSTLDKFLTNSRSFTIDEKVLRFYLDDAQMEYAGFKISDPKPLESIKPGQKITDVEYVSDNGLKAYVNVKNRSKEVLSYKRTNSVKFYAIRLVKGNSDSQLHLPNKLGWDNTIEEYKKSYGKPLSETSDKDGNTILKFGEDVPEMSEGYTLTLVFSDKGLTEFTIEIHKV